MANQNKELSGTFALNRGEPIHRWYSYIEGYSSALVENELEIIKKRNIKTIFDPFGGTGTTLLSGSIRGIEPYFSETNPFMQKVALTKINSVIDICSDDKAMTELLEFQNSLNEVKLKRSRKKTWDGFEKYYEESNLRDILALKERIGEVKNTVVNDLLMLGLSSILVSCSKMVRRGDLRYAKAGEKKEEISVIDSFIRKLDEIIEDINEYGKGIKCRASLLASDARNINCKNLIDCVITSPPYLNGTNYIRNTKLELKLNNFVKSEADLSKFHSQGIVAGINNVSKRTKSEVVLPVVEKYVEELQNKAYDKRIPEMVSSYFVDMDRVFDVLHIAMRNKGIFIMDIGDSQFAGVHIPTHRILEEICSGYGFRIYDEEILRKRHSKNGMELTQRIMRFELNK